MIGLVKQSILSTLDLARGYWQVPLTEEFITPRGLFQFRVMPFGLSGVPATFQRMMDQLIGGLEEQSAAYIDDSIVFSESCMGGTLGTH